MRGLSQSPLSGCGESFDDQHPSPLCCSGYNYARVNAFIFCCQGERKKGDMECQSVHQLCQFSYNLDVRVPSQKKTM